MTGWIKLHRELMDKPIWESSTAAQKVILITLLTMANHKEKEWEFAGKKYVAKPGQFVTSLSSIAEKSGKDISVQNVRTALKRFEKYDFLTDQSTNKNRLITIVNWASYQRKDDIQEDEETGSQQANQQAANKQLTTNKNVRKKEDKEEVLKKKSPKVAPSDQDYENAHLLFDLMQGNMESAKAPNFEDWAHTFRKLRNDYNHTDKFLKYVIQYSQERSYRKSNIRSANSFRKAYESLYIDAREEVKKQKVIPISKNNQHDFESLKEKLRHEQEQQFLQQQQNRIT